MNIAALSLTPCSDSRGLLQASEPTPAAAGAPATCGELVQGFLDGSEFLINCPIDLEALAFIRPMREPEVHVRTRGQYSKASNSVALLLRETGLTRAGWGVELSFVSSVPRGKGLASSTAEITAALLATVRAFHLNMSVDEIGRLAVSHDASDGVVYPGISYVNQLSGFLKVSYGTPPPLRVLVVDTGGYVDSLGFDRIKARAHAAANETELRQAVHLVSRGIATGNVKLIGAGATMSARLNDVLLPKPGFSDLLHKVLEAGAVGLNAAHTGTVLGVLYDPIGRPGLSDRLRRVIEPIQGQASIIGDFAVKSGIGGVRS